MIRGRWLDMGLMAVFLLSFMMLDVNSAAAQDDFYKGKRVRMIVPYSAGGGYDLYARTIARHWGRHIA